MTEHNHTPWTFETIQQFPYLGKTVNMWRNRDISLFAIPDNTESLVSIGVAFSEMLRVIVVEPRASYATALDYIKHGKVYVSS